MLDKTYEILMEEKKMWEKLALEREKQLTELKKQMVSQDTNIETLRELYDAALTRLDKISEIAKEGTEGAAVDYILKEK